MVRRGDGRLDRPTSAWISATFQGDGHACASNGLVAGGKEQTTRIGETDDAHLGEVEAADLVGRPVTVLDRANEPQT